MSSAECGVRISQLACTYRGETVLNGVDFEAGPGTVFALFGYSGSGKTTLISVLAGLLPYRWGKVQTCDRREIGLVTQFPSLFPRLTACENLQAIGMMKGIPASDLARLVPLLVEELGLGALENRRVTHLPQGAKQRVSLACALINEPKLLLLDDILARTDPDSAQVIIEALLRRVDEGSTCIWATDRLEEIRTLARACSLRIGYLREGSLTVYQPQEFFELFARSGEREAAPSQEQEGGRV